VKLFHKALFFAGILLSFELALLAALAILLNQAEVEATRADRSKNVVLEAGSIISLFYEAAAAITAYGLTENQTYNKRFESIAQELPERVDKLKTLNLESERDREIMRNIDKSVGDALGILLKGKHIIDNRGEYGALVQLNRLYPATLQASNKLVSQINNLVEEHKKIQEGFPAQHKTSKNTIKGLIIAGIILNILLAVLLVTLFSQGIAQRLATMTENSYRLARGERLLPIIPGKDEIVHLDVVFHQMADSLEHAAQQKQEFISIVSHDLRTPLASIEAALKLLSSGKLGTISDKANDIVKLAQGESERLLRLVNELLDIARIEAGKIELDLQETTFDNICEKSLRAVERFAEEKNVSIRVTPQHVILIADEDRLIQVLVNLLSNAIKFSEAGETVEVTATEESDWVEVHVKDQGCGIPAQFSEKIFDRFEQASLSGTKDKRGAGLGLAICKLIIDAHGGKIGVNSEANKGSTFWFRVPKVQKL
jgi:signal transduction histidine kinase